MGAGVPFTSLLSHFGQPIVVRVPGAPPVSTSGIWDAPRRRPATEDGMRVRDVLQRDMDRRVMAVPLSATLRAVPEGAEITAAEPHGTDLIPWSVVEHERIEADHVRVVLVPANRC